MRRLSNLFSSVRAALMRLGLRVLRLIGAVCVILLLLAAAFYFNAPPGSFPQGKVFTVPSGGTVSSVAASLKTEGYVSSSRAFSAFVRIFGRKGIIAGDYYFPEKYSLISLAERLIHGNFGMTPAKITVPEGYTVSDIAGLFSDSRFYKFNKDEFLALGKGKEGYLFPDTYFFMPSASASDVFTRLSDNFDGKIAPYLPAIATSTHSLSDIVTVASILEKEAATSTDRRIISGIIWQRLKLKMPLQVDATLGYVLNKGTFQLTTDDLSLDNPYNTYIYKGLPPTPIGNPGLDSIEAALYPTATKYLYYLSDKSGTVYYAKTLAEHDANREKYLNK